MLNFKNIITSVSRRLGCHVYTSDGLPPGVDWLLDIRRFLNPSGASLTMVDVGANIGQTVAEMRAAFPSASIYAFEPFEDPYLKLKVNVSGFPEVQVFQLALGSVAGSKRIEVNASSVHNSLRDEGNSSANTPTERVEIETLDRFCARHSIASIDVLKTDTEGFDLEVLRGADQLLAGGKVSFVYSEVTFCPDNVQNTPFFPVHEFLVARNFRLLGLYELYPLHHFSEPNLFCNALFVSRAIKPSY